MSDPFAEAVTQLADRLNTLGKPWAMFIATDTPEGVRVKAGGSPGATFEQEMDMLSAINGDVLGRADTLQAERQ